ncbi:MAG TPA: DUF2585 family protein [Candidatus Polarisedimenticolia bacterium]|nr:DUF2585 family protein [Candidatus Polarisedimenticolia bacterium]
MSPSESSQRSVIEFMERHRWVAMASIAVLALTALIEDWLGRSPLGPDGRFGWWDGDIWSSENSQRVADAYSFSHIEHGILFFALLWLVARRLPLSVRFLIAMLLETGWEVLENSPIIINRYREATIALGYVGDSVLNSCCDVMMMALGFVFASRVPVWVSVGAALAMEAFCLLWVRDNLLLNVIMLLYPIGALKAWQSAGHALH